MSTTDGAGDGPHAAAPKPISRRLISAAGTLAAVVVIPVVLAYFAGGLTAAGGAALGAVLGFVLSLFAGWKLAAIFIPPTLAASGLSALLHGTPWWVLGLGLLGLLTGFLATRGLLVPLAFMGLAWSVSQPTDPPGDLAGLLLAAAIAAAYAVALARRAGVPGEVRSVVPTGRTAVVGAIGLAIAAALAGAISQNWDNENGYWLPMTVFILAMPAPGVRLSQRAVARVAGTGVGVAVAIVLTAVVDLPVVDYVLAFVGLMFTLAVPKPRWLNASTTAFAIVMALTPTSGSEVGGSRLGATAVAAVLVVVIAGVLGLIARLLPQSADQRAVVAEFEAERSADEA